MVSKGRKSRRPGQNLRELRPGYWKVTVNMPASQNPDGKRHRRVAYVEGGVRKAEAKRRELLAQRDQGKLRPRTAGTVGEYLDGWLRGKRARVAARTAERWGGLIKNQIKPHIGSLLLRDLKPRDLRKMYADLLASGLSGTTVQKSHALLSMVMRQAVVDEDLAVNPCLAVEAPQKDTKQAGALDEKQAADLLEKLAGTPIYVPVLVTLDGGLRRGELLALKWEDLDDAVLTVQRAVEEVGTRVSLRGTKTGRSRTVRLTERAVEALRQHRKTQTAQRLALADRWVDLGLIFSAADEHRGKPAGRIWRPSSFSRVYREMTRAAGFTIGVHTLRHTHATIMMRAGRPAREVADRLGHSTTKLTTDTYSHVLPDQQQEGVEAYERRLGLVKEGE